MQHSNQRIILTLKAMCAVCIAVITYILLNFVICNITNTPQNSPCSHNSCALRGKPETLLKFCFLYLNIYL